VLAPWRRSSGVDEYPFFECHRKWTAAFDPTETSRLIAFDTGLDAISRSPPDRKVRSVLGIA
jgi:hypothetical protein